MATYRIDFSTNASRVANEIDKVNKALTEAVRTSKPIEIRLDDTKLSQQLNTTFKQLDKEIAKYERQLRKIQVGSPAFGAKASQIGQLEGQRQMGQMTAQAIRLRGQAGAFPQESFAGLSREIQAAKISASMIQPNTEAWVNLQREIARLNLDLQKADKLAESIQLTESLGAFSPGSLNALEAKLTILRNRAREISPSTTEWKKVNAEIVKAEQNIEKQTRRPLTGGQRMGAAGGAFLYGGGLGGGVGSAVGGIAGGLMGGAPGAFTGAAIGQLTDNIGAMMASVTKGASTIAQLQRGLALASIDAKDFAEAQEAIRQSSDTLVVPIEQVYRQFTQLRVNTKQYNLSVKDTQQILEGVVLAVSSTGGSLEDVDGAMRAVVQIFSKGSVQAEELRGQLGERFPGAVVKFAQANKMSFEELQSNLEEGKVTVGDFVEFAKKNYEDYAKFSERLATGPEFAGRRLEKAMNDMQIAIGAALGPAGAEFQDFFTDTIKGFTEWVNENKDFIGSFLKDWAVFVTEFARIVGGIVKIALQVSTAIVKVFRGAILEIRRLLGMVGVAEIKTQLDQVNAEILAAGGKDKLQKQTRGARMNPLLTRQSQLEQQFKAAGGEAALANGVKPAGGDFQYGGPGAGMNLDTASGGKDKTKKAKELKDFAEDEVRRLQEQLTKGKLLIDLQADMASSQKELAKAELEYSIGIEVVGAQYEAAVKSLSEYKEGQRAAAQASMDNAAVVAREIVTAEYRKKILGDLIGRSEDYENKTNALQDSIAALKAGQENLSEVDKLEAEIKRKTIGLTKEQLQIVEPFIAKTRQQALAVQGLSDQEKKLQENLKQTQNLQKARTELGMIGAGLRAGYTGEAASVFESAMIESEGNVDHSSQMATLETQAMQLRAVFESIQGAINGVSSAFANVLTEGITSMISGTATAKEVFASFLQSVGQALSQAASQMIATYIAIGIAKLFAGLGGGGNPAGSGGGISDSLPGIRQYAGGLGGGGAPGSMPFAPPAFANGGIVTGPTLSLIGEGKYNEAVVPLPDGRSIPVQLGERSARDLMGNGAPGMPQAPSLSMKFETTKINGVEYVSREQLEQAMAETRRASIAGGAQRGMSMTLDKIKQSPSTRSSIGIR